MGIPFGHVEAYSGVLFRSWPFHSMTIQGLAFLAGVPSLRAASFDIDQQFRTVKITFVYLVVSVYVFIVCSYVSRLFLSEKIRVGPWG